MNPKNMIQNTCLPEIKTLECCLQAEEPIQEVVPQPDWLELLAKRDNQTSPYYHSEIF